MGQPGASEPQLPSLSDTASDLKSVVHLGLRASALATHRIELEALFSMPSVVGLETETDSDDARAQRLVNLVRQVLLELADDDAELADGLGRLFGSTDASGTTSPKIRRENAAPLLVGWRQQSGSFLKRQQEKFCTILADRVIRHETAAFESAVGPNRLYPVPPSGASTSSPRRTTIEQQLDLRIDSDRYVTLLQEVNTVRIEVDEPVTVRHEFSFYPVFEFSGVSLITTGETIEVLDGYGNESLHLSVGLPQLPRGALHTYGFQVSLRGGDLDYFTVTSTRSMKTVTVRVVFEVPPKVVWRVENVALHIEIPRRCPKDAEKVKAHADGGYVGRFISPRPRCHVGLAWEW